MRGNIKGVTEWNSTTTAPAPLSHYSLCALGRLVETINDALAKKRIQLVFNDQVQINPLRRAEHLPSYRS